MTGHHSVYPSQILSMKKSASLQVTLGGNMDDVETNYEPHAKSLSGAISNLIWRLVQAVKWIFSRSSRPNDSDNTKE
jgi:hypothetical protein